MQEKDLKQVADPSGRPLVATLKYTLEIYDLPHPSPEGQEIGYRIICNDLPMAVLSENLLVTDADYLVWQLSQTLAHIGQPLSLEDI